MLGLLVRITPYADESLPGFLHRLGEANGLSGTFMVERFKSENYAGQESCCIPAGVSASWRGIARELRAPSTRPMPIWNLRRRRYCGKCLGEMPYWRASWDLSLTTACPRHRVRLLDTCRHCGTALDWSAHMTPACPVCGHALSSDRPDYLPAASLEEIWLSRELALRLTGKGHLGNRHFEHLNLADFHEIAFRLGACAARPNARKPLKIADSGSLEAGRPICQAAAAMLRDWPNGFSRSLDHIRAQRNILETWKLGSALGPVYREVSRRFTAPEFRFVRDALEKYLQDAWQAPLALRHSNLSSSTISTHRWLPVDEISRRLDLKPSIVSRIANTGEVASRSRQYACGRIAQIIDATEVSRIADELRTAVDAEQAADLLGLSTARVKQLIRLRFLKIWGGSPTTGSTWLIGRKQIDAILGLDIDVPVLPHIGEYQVPVAHLLRHTFDGEHDFGAFMTGILVGDIDIVGLLGNSPRVSDWVVDQRQIDKLSDKPPTIGDADVSVVEAAKLLSVKQEVAYALVRHGAIKSRLQKVGNRTTRLVRRQDIEAFRRDYIFGSELAKILGKSPKSLVDVLKRRHVSPAGGPTVADRPCRQYYWRRSKALEAVIQSQRIS